MAPALNAYGLWLIPAEPAAAACVPIINRLAQLEPGSPTFTPHITLLHPIDICMSPAGIERKLEEAVRGLGPLTVNVLAATTGQHYHQSVLAPMDPSQPLLQLRQAVEDAFDVRPPSYFPHLSLQYGDISAARRQELADAANQMALPRQVDITDVAIVRLKGTATEWRVVCRVPL